MKRAAFVLAAFLAAAPAAACSVVPGYKVPTTWEMALKSEAIILGEVTGERSGDDAWSGAATVRPLALLKGKTLPGTIEIPQSSIAKPDWHVTRSDPRELRAPNPDALAGSCSRYAFEKGMKLVLFLTRGKNGELTVLRAPFARDSEDVAGENALWVKAVRIYGRLSALPFTYRPASMRQNIRRLRAAGDADSLAIAKDLELEMARPDFLLINKPVLDRPN